MNISQSSRAGLLFPVRKFHMKLRNLPQRVNRVSKGASVYMTAVLEYLTAEMVELSGNICKQDRKRRITPRHIKLAIMEDAELENLLKNIVIPQGGVLPGASIMPLGKPINKKVKVVKKSPIAKSSAKKIGVYKPSTNFNSLFNTKAAGTGLTTLSQRVLNKGQSLTVVQGDITNVKVDAIVSHYYLGGQVGSAISRKGGPELQTIMNNHRKNSNKSLNTCDADITDASKNLLCKKLIHINSPSWDQSLQVKKINELSQTVENILVLVENEKLKSIALPSISSGGNMFPKQVAAETILRAINKHFKILEKNDSLPKSSIQEVFFVLYDKESVDVYTSELGKLDIQ